MYEIVILPKAAKQLRKLPLEVQIPLAALIDDLAIAPRPDGVKKLKERAVSIEFAIASIGWWMWSRISAWW